MSTITIQGYVAPLAGNDSHRCLVAVVVDDDTEYHIVPRGAGSDLIELLSSQVEVTGVVVEEPDAPPLLQVRAYKVIDPDEEVW